MVEGKELAPIDIGALTNAPAHLQGEKPEGFANVEKDDVTMPRLKLLQALSPEVTDSGMTAGIIVHSADPNLKFGEKVQFIPLGFFKSRIMWKDPKQGGGQICTAVDGRTARSPKGQTAEGKATASCAECVLKDWNNDTEDEDEKQPKCTLYMNFPSLVNGMPMALSFERTKIKAGKDLISLAQLLGKGGYPIYAGKYLLSVVASKNKQGQPYFTFQVSSRGFIQDKAEYEEAKKLAHTFENVKVEVDAEGNSSAPSAPARNDI